MSFVQGIEPIDLWVKKGTPDVPDDGKFHVVHQGKIVASYRRETQAVIEYRRLVKEISYTPDPSLAKPPDLEAATRAYIEYQMNAEEEFWAAAHSHRHKGGWGR